jgi:hypothetical protein
LHPYCSDSGDMKVSSSRQSDSLVLSAPTGQSTTLLTPADEPVDEPVDECIEAGVQRLEQHDDDHHGCDRVDRFGNLYTRDKFENKR